MGTNLDPVVGLLRYALIALLMDGLMTILHSILQRLLRLADPKFAAILDRYVLLHRGVMPSLTARQHRTITILCPI